MTYEELQRIINRFHSRQTSYRANNKFTNTEDKAMQALDRICQKYQWPQAGTGTNDNGITDPIHQYYRQEQYHQIYQLLMDEIKQDVIDNDAYKNFRLTSFHYESCQFCQNLEKIYDQIISEMNNQHNENTMSENTVSKDQFDQYNSEIQKKIQQLQRDNEKRGSEIVELKDHQNQLQQQVETYKEENLSLKHDNEQKKQAINKQRQQLQIMTNSIKHVLANPGILSGEHSYHIRIQNLADDDFDQINKFMEELATDANQANSNQHQNTTANRQIEDQINHNQSSSNNHNDSLKKQQQLLTKQILPKSAHDAVWVLSREYLQCRRYSHKETQSVSQNDNGFFKTNDRSHQIKTAISNIIKLAAIDERHDKAAIHNETMKYLQSLTESDSLNDSVKQRLRPIVEENKNLKKDKFIDNCLERVKTIADHYDNSDQENSYIPVDQQTLSELNQMLDEANRSNQLTG